MIQYAKIIYRVIGEKHPYHLPKPRIRLMKIDKLYDFQRKLLRDGNQIISVTRLTKEMFEEEKKRLEAKMKKAQ